MSTLHDDIRKFVGERSGYWMCKNQCAALADMVLDEGHSFLDQAEKENESLKARLAEAERDNAALRTQLADAKSALEDMCGQYLSVRNGKLHHDFMSAGEHAFDVLGWPDTGHPLDKSCLCEVEGCGNGWTCGWKDAAGVYHTTCSLHYTNTTKPNGEAG